MKFGAPLLSTELSGALGGVVGSTARGGVGYFRARVRPGNPRSSYQSYSRLVLAGLAAGWVSTLTNSQRLAWEAIAPPTLSGIDAYIKGNAQIVLGEDTPVATAPATLALTTNPFTAVALDVSDSAIKFTNSTTDADLRVNVYAQLRPQKASQLSQKGNTTLIAKAIDLSTAGVNTIALAPFPGLDNAVAGDIVYIRFVQYNVNGQVAIEQVERVTVQA